MTFHVLHCKLHCKQRFQIRYRFFHNLLDFSKRSFRSAMCAHDLQRYIRHVIDCLHDSGECGQIHTPFAGNLRLNRTYRYLTALPVVTDTQRLQCDLSGHWSDSTGSSAAAVRQIWLASKFSPTHLLSTSCIKRNAVSGRIPPHY